MPNMLLEFWIWCWQQIQIREYGAGEYSAYFTPVARSCFSNYKNFHLIKYAGTS